MHIAVNENVQKPRTAIWPSPNPISPRLRVVVSSVSSDSHTWNLVFLQLFLEELGHEVINLGACAPDELILSQCLDLHPDLLVISSINGHGHIDGERLIRKLRLQADLQSLPSVIGGKLGIRGNENIAYNEQLLKAGFDAVFEASGGMQAFESYVQKIAIGHQEVSLPLKVAP